MMGENGKSWRPADGLRVSRGGDARAGVLSARVDSQRKRTDR